MIVDQDPKAWYDKILDSSKENQPLAIVLFVLFVSLGFNVVVWIHSNNKVDSAEAKIVIAENKLENLRNDVLKNNITYNEGYIKGREERDTYWEPKYDKLLEESKKDYNDVIEKRINELTIKSERVLQETKKMNRQFKRQ